MNTKGRVEDFAHEQRLATIGDIRQAVGEMKGALIVEIETALARVMRLVAIFGVAALLMSAVLVIRLAADPTDGPAFAPDAAEAHNTVPPLSVSAAGDR